MGFLRSSRATFSMESHGLSQYIIQAPLAFVPAIFVVICLVTRVLTEIQRRISQSKKDAQIKNPIRIPYWIPFVGSAASFVTDIEGTIARDRDSSGDGVISYRLGPSKYYIINMPSLVQQVFSQKLSTLSKERVLEWFMTVAFADGHAARNEPHAFHEDHKILNIMLKDDFITEATTKTVRAVETETASLVNAAPSQAERGRPLELWEHAGDVTFNNDGSANANFYGLITYYVGQIVIDMLWGKALIRNNLHLQKDLWDFDEGVHHLTSTVMAFSAAGRRASAARSRLAKAMVEWHTAMAAIEGGGDPGPLYKYEDWEDVSEVLRLRVKSWEENHASTKLLGATDVSVLWGVNVNSNKNIFWMLLHIYSRPQLLSEIREEIAEYVKLSSTGERGPSGFPKLQIDVDGLCKNCPLIKASFYETMRMNMGGLGVRQVNRELILTESTADAAMFGKKKAQSYRIPAGSTLVLANGTMQKDSRIFEDPGQFQPRRFIGGEGKKGSASVTMKNLHTFGGGLYKCKGRYFAEKEMMLFTASILVMWDVGPTAGSDALTIPGVGLAGGACSPAKDVRVRLTRRCQ